MARIRSGWWDNTDEARIQEESLYEVEITRREFQLLMRIRQLTAGSYQMTLEKSARGMRGLQYFEVVERS